MLLNTWKVFFIVLALWLNSVVAASAPDEELESFLSSVSTLSADFVQQTLDDKGVVTQLSRGKFYLKRPGRFRWTYADPYPQEIVADGTEVWFYDPDLEQVTVRTIDSALGSAPALLLSGQLKLSERFVVKRAGRDERGSWVELVPKEENDVFRKLRVEMQDGKLALMELADNFGQLTRIRFSKMEINPPLKDELFKFVPPPGVDVFRG